MDDPPPEPLFSFAEVEHDAAFAERAERVRGRYRAAGPILPNTREALRVELTYHSNAIEGSTLTLRDTQLVVEGREPNTGKSLREIYEARNHDRALRKVEAWADAGRRAVTEADMLAIHAEVMADIDPAGTGRCRTGRVLIASSRHAPPGGHKFAVLVPAFLELANQDARNPVIRAAELHYNFVAVHPFADGNGRTGRLMMNHLLLQAGYPPALVTVERRAEYLAALEEANAGRCAPFAAFVLSCVELAASLLLGEEN